MRVFWLCAVALLFGGCGAAAGPPPPQWLPQESWPGGKQYDPRLEQTAKFWGAGVPAAEVFASITNQTGVLLGFSPPDDDNARICLNLYLNPEQPPTLRDLMAQVSWVMDCAWAVEGRGEEGRYLLLHTSIGDGVLTRLTEESDREGEERNHREREAVADLYRVAIAELHEIADAPAMTPQEARERYQGKDDFALAGVLDPARRAETEFLLSLPQSDHDRLAQGDRISRKWLELTQQQRAHLKAAMLPALERLAAEVRQGRRAAGERWGDWEWVEQQNLEVSVVTAGGGFRVSVVRWETESLGTPVDIPHLQLYQDSRLEDTTGPQFAIALRRLLGEQVSDEEERSLFREYLVRLDKERKRVRLEAQLSSLCRVSAEVADRLRKMRLPARADEEYALWQLQQAVAAISGMHVISDSFWQPARSAAEALSLFTCGYQPEPDALLLLQASCAAVDSRDGLLADRNEWSKRLVRWEWGDAGGFLRFRSADRDVWRAALLPAGAVETLRAWLDPYLPEDLASAGVLTVPIGARHCGAVLARLTTLQRRWGGVLTYGCPADKAEEWHQAFRGQLLLAVQQREPLYAMLSRLDDAQWERVQQEGLRVGTDFALPDLREWWYAEDIPRLAGYTLHLQPVEPDTAAMLSRESPGEGWLSVVFLPADATSAAVEAGVLATEVRVHPTRPAPLVNAPASAR